MNVEFLKKLAKHMRRIRHEKHYSQLQWGAKDECGTAACLAGHAVMLAGYRLKFAKGAHVTELCASRGQEPVEIQDAAGDILGLNERERERLFNGAPSKGMASRVRGAMGRSSKRFLGRKEIAHRR